MDQCVFCGIASGELKTKILYENERIMAFYDLEAVAPVHFLVIPKVHIVSAKAIDKENSGVIAEIFEVIAELEKKLELVDGFRVVTNSGKLAGQTVKHLHFHVLGGRVFEWPPG
ncbi:histidine triad nucleotide-binding protein [Clostridia bacterium]|nr:histidine triad nucleotide-binding protein [Clostridia bacterium]